MRNYVVITEKLQKKKKKPKTPPTKQSTTNPLKSSRYATWQLLGPRGLNVQFGLFPCFLRKHQQAQDHCKWPKRVHLFLLWIRLDHQKFQFSVTDLLTLKNAAFKKKNPQKVSSLHCHWCQQILTSGAKRKAKCSKVNPAFILQWPYLKYWHIAKGAELPSLNHLNSSVHSRNTAGYTACCFPC